MEVKQLSIDSMYLAIKLGIKHKTFEADDICNGAVQYYKIVKKLKKKLLQNKIQGQS